MFHRNILINTSLKICLFYISFNYHELEYLDGALRGGVAMGVFSPLYMEVPPLKNENIRLYQR